MLAIEMADSKKDKPIVVSHGMIMGLVQGQAKMSKSDPNSAIFMEDSAKEVEKKIKNAFCPPKIVQNNPILDYCKNIVFPAKGYIDITRKPENGGDKYL